MKKIILGLGIITSLMSCGNMEKNEVNKIKWFTFESRTDKDNIGYYNVNIPVFLTKKRDTVSFSIASNIVDSLKIDSATIMDMLIRATVHANEKVDHPQTYNFNRGENWNLMYITPENTIRVGMNGTALDSVRVKHDICTYVDFNFLGEIVYEDGHRLIVTWTDIETYSYHD